MKNSLYVFDESVNILNLAQDTYICLSDITYMTYSLQEMENGIDEPMYQTFWDITTDLNHTLLPIYKSDNTIEIIRQ